MKSRPQLAVLREKLLDWKQQLLPRHPMAEAIGYALSQWTPLSVFCSDGAVPIDNNASEREMKRIVLNRKNSLFVGNPRGGRTAAILASITTTCRRHEIDPQLYFTQAAVQSYQIRKQVSSPPGCQTTGNTTNLLPQSSNPQPCGLNSAHDMCHPFF